MKTPHRFLALVLLAILAPVASIGAERPTKPNVVFILVDDQGYYDLGCYGADEVRTPRIDRLAAEGVRFTDYYAAAPICSPSRAGLLTGRYPRRFGLETWVQRADSAIGIPAAERTLAELFRENGYATACIGKWHLGHEAEFHPLAQGFDHFFGLLHNLDPVETIFFEDKGGVPLLRGEEVVRRPAHPDVLTARYTDEAIDFIRTYRERPFFLYLAHTMLHVPIGVGEAFRGSSEWGEYGDAIQELDHHIGRIHDTLVELGLGGNTVFVYTSDNGRGPGRKPEQPLRGRKLTTWEAGIRVPCVAWGPGLGLPAGRTESRIATALDWFPTLASLAGLAVPADRPMDGRDLAAALTDGKRDSINAGLAATRPWNPPGEWADLVSEADYRDAFFYHGAEGALAAVRSGKWKLFLAPELTLYDLEADPAESRPVRDAAALRMLRGLSVIFQEEMARSRLPDRD